jgi:hypothetical protein
MKKIIFIIVLFYAIAFGQSWNNTVTTTVSESSLEKMDLFTNKNGNHLLIKKSNGNIVYYNINSSGTVDNNKTETLESSGDYPTIAGSNNKIYAFYKSGNNVKGKYSTNGGTDWTALTNNISTSSNACNGIDAVYAPDLGIHVVYAMRDNGNYFETYYYLLNPSDSWVNYKNVTDYGSEVGGVPSVTFSSNRVHVSYNSGEATPPYIGEGVSKSRDKIGSSWQTPQLVSDGEYDDNTSREKLQVRGSKLFAIFFDNWVSLGQFGYKIQVKSRDLTATSWPGSYTQIFNAGDPRILMGAETTANEKLNVVHNDIYGIQHIDYDGNNWSDEFTITEDYINYEEQHLGFSITSNDMFVLWKKTSSDYIKYRQYDAVPLAPQNLAVQIYTQGNDTYPKLTWTLNNEPDVYIKLNAYEIWRRTKCWSQEWSSWSLKGYKNGNQSEYIDYTISGLYAESCTAEYKIRAKDVGNNLSPYSSTVSINFSKYNKLSQDIEKYEYVLSQNYPNPFNPSTQISYSLAQDAFVTLQVYDMLGNVVAELVNAGQTAGIHEINFDASELSSGIYIYRVTAMNGERILYSESKRMLMIK